VRTFDEINATMAELTGVSALDGSVSNTFDLVRQSLPAIPTMEAVLASHQVAIAQLAIEYCNAAVETTSVRNALWGGSFTAWTTAPNSQPGGWELGLADPLLDRLIGLTQLETQPDRALLESEITQLVHGRVPADPSRLGLAATNGNSAARTEDIGKAVCSSILGSAAMLVK
jgi:hypothetical protein